MSDNMSLGVLSMFVGMSTVMFVLGMLALLTKAYGIIDRYFEKPDVPEEKPSLEGEIDPLIIAAMMGAISTFSTKKFRITRIQYLDTSAQSTAWQDISRTQQLMGRTPIKRGGNR
ncbi:MAG: OadG family protein [bacterium]|nr:OadG family protein [bacterium]